MTSSMRVYGGFASPNDAVDRVRPAPPTNPSSVASGSPTWAPPAAASRAVVSQPAVWPPPIVWPAPDLSISALLSMAPRRVTPADWPPPPLSRSPWPAPVPVAASATGLARRRGPSPVLGVLRPGFRDSRRTDGDGLFLGADVPAGEPVAPPSPIAHTTVVEHDRSNVRRGRSLAYAVAGLAATVIGFVVVVIR